jgi:hypothetical protein
VSVRNDIETASDAEWAIASQRADLMDILLSQSNAASVGEAARELGLSIAMMYRLLARYRKNPTPSSLLPAVVFHDLCRILIKLNVAYLA